jgi:D-sedoheptulose 7-phosphate isomerase
MPEDYTSQYLMETARIAQSLDQSQINAMIEILADVRDTGRLFILGVGGSAGNASHAVNDFRKIVGIESYAPTDNVSELTARTNDEGWESVFAGWLAVSRLCAADVVMVFSVGGGDRDRNVSPNLVAALELAKDRGARIIGVVGRDGGHTARVADACVIIPPINPEAITPHSEAFQAVVWHLIVSHPRLKRNAMKWEATR